MKARLLMPSRYVAPLLVLALYACGEAPLSVGEIVERWEGPNPFGPRLVGGFEPSRCAPAPSPGGLGMRCEGRVSPAPDLLRLAERRRPLGPGSDASASPSAGDYRAEALWRLLLRPDGHVDALALLEEASAAFPRDPHVQSDLAALRLVRADLTGEMVDLVRALEHALAATEAGAPPPEAVFNLALALEALGLSERAEGVWERAAAIETDVTWREEITRRLRRAREVRSTPAPGPPPPEATPDRWRAFALRSPQRARELALETLLPAWGRAVRDGDAAVAARHLAAAEVAGSTLVEAEGDATVAESVAVIAATEGGRIDDLAAGHMAYGRAREIEITNRREAVALLRTASARLARAGSIAGLWADVRLGFLIMTDPERPEVAAAERLHRDVAERADVRRLFPALAARATWGVALNQGRRGRNVEARHRYEECSLLFERASEGPNLARSQALVAEAYRLLGDNGSAWAWTRRALPGLAAAADHQFLQGTLRGGADMAQSLDLERASGALLAAALAAAEASGEPINVAEALLWQAKNRARSGRREEALADLRRARTVLADADPFLESHLRLAEGAVLSAVDPDRAQELASQALEYFAAADLKVNQAEALGVRAEANRRLGRSDVAKADLDAALRLLVLRVSEERDDAVRLAFATALRKTVDAVVELTLDDLEDPSAAFEATELMRRLLFGDRDDHRRLLALLSEGRGLIEGPDPTLGGDVLLATWLLEERLLVWRVGPEGVELSAERLDLAAARDAVAVFVSRARDGRPGSDGSAEAADAAALVARLHGLGELPAAIEGTVLLMPDPALYGLPIAALPGRRGSGHLVEELAFAVLPHLPQSDRPAAGERRIDRGGEWRALLVGDPESSAAAERLPPLPHSRAEVAAIRSLYRLSPEPRLGADATRRVLSEGLEDFEVLHFAGHALTSAAGADASYLVVAPTDATDDGLVYAAELAGPDLERLRLVVLSACSSVGAGAPSTGLAGLARPFLQRGADAVLGTLWPLDDEVAKLLMTEFHRGVVDGLRASEALRRAQLAVARDAAGRWRGTGTWAGLYLIGELQ